ncbi:MAG TPA: hydroxyethylthiazole kinase [Spirochaetota bacterium]|nr:hydroxyethylthiazole kinase [Spirochaetota bacterium]
MDVNRYLELVRKNQPLVHHLTNWVTIYDCAQVVKSFGASPVMAHAAEESADMTSIASALVLNIGTLTPEFIESMISAALSANRKGIPVVLDVCGAGATKLRDEMCFKLLDKTRIDIIKGNASEVARISGADVQTRGVDSGTVSGSLVNIAAELAVKRKCTVVITGKDDIITDGRRCFTVSNGHELMVHVVGTGCMAASVIGTFAGAAPDDIVEAAAAGLCCFEIAAELAVKKCGGPGSFTNCLFDAIYTLDKDKLETMKWISECAVTTL